MKELGALLLLLCASNAPPLRPVPHDIVSGPGTVLYDGWPPERYMTETRLTMIFAPFDRVQVLCADGRVTPLPKGWEYMGCHRRGAIITFLPVKGDGEHLARIIAHELAHHRLWPLDHPL